MEKIVLTQKERNTFYGLVKYPNLNDRTLAEILGEKMSTVTSIRRRLRDRGHYIKIRVPQFQTLSCEILCISHGSFKPVAPYSTDVLSKIQEAVPATFFGISNPYHFFMLGVSLCYTDARRTYDGYYQNQKFLKAIDENDLSFTYLPFSMTKLHNCFDFAPLLKDVFGISSTFKEKTTHVEGSKDINLTPTEKKVFMGLVKFPELADKALAGKIKVSRQAVSKMRKKFEAQGLLQTVIVPDLAQLGLGMIIFTHYRLNPKRLNSLNLETLEDGSGGLPSFFSCSTPYEFFSLSAFTSYQEYERVSEKFFKHYIESKALLKSPSMIPFSIEDVTYFRNHVYSSVLKYVLKM